METDVVEGGVMLQSKEQHFPARTPAPTLQGKHCTLPCQQHTAVFTCLAPPLQVLPTLVGPVLRAPDVEHWSHTPSKHPVAVRRPRHTSHTPCLATPHTGAHAQWDVP